MKNLIPRNLPMIGAVLLAMALNHSSAQPVTNLYVIMGGEYIACCGIAGEVRQSLPSDGQSHIEIVRDSAQQRARLTILSFFDGEPIFQVLENGRLNPGYIEFGQPFAPGGPGLGIRQHYIVSNTASGLRMNGLTVYPQQGADMFYRFAHSNVVANLLATGPIEATIRVASVEICWPSISNALYQVQYRTAVDRDAWFNLQSSVPGNGGTRCVVDSVGPAQPRRFYRVIPVP